MGTGRAPRQRTLHLVAGGALAAAAAGLDHLLGIPPAWGAAQTAGVAAGVLVVVAGWLLRGRPARVSTGLALGGLLALVAVAAAEVGFRLIGHDFARQERAHLAIPPYFRESIVPLPEVYFGRPGPQRWEGQVLNLRLEQLGIEPNPYADEEPVVIEYDRDGFRNPPGPDGSVLDDWELAVIGDSFTELGYLPHEELFTTRLADELGLRVKNLGVSETGNLSHAAYLRNFGFAPSTREVLLVFFEGNDPLETAVEYRALLRFRATGERPAREFERQTSLMRALYGALEPEPPKKVHRLDAARFTGPGEGAGEPLSLFFAPRALHEITAQLVEHFTAHDPDFGPTQHAEVDVEAALEYAFGELARLAREHGARARVAFMPCKLRTHHGQLDFTERALDTVRAWQPTDFPAEIRALAERHEMGFIDLTPALVDEARGSGSLLFNTMYDCHLNRRGSRAVAAALVEALRGTPRAR